MTRSAIFISGRPAFGALRRVPLNHLLKFLSCVVIFHILGMECCQALPEIDALEAKIRAELPDSEWTIAKDWCSVTVTRSSRFWRSLA
jgi:hypothetical protein